jgi:DNA-binding GntR family transcriptional regulator
MEPEDKNPIAGEKETGLTEKAYLFIKEAIVNYHLKPGAALGLRTLAATLKMSQTPVREALLRLEQEQFIQRRSRKGFTVASFTLDQVRDLYDLRIVIELAGVHWAVRRLDRPALEKMEKSMEETEALLKSGPISEILSLEHHFHALILEAAGNTPMQRMGRVVLDRIRLIQNLSLYTSDRVSQAQVQHREIYQALLDQNAETAATLMESHLKEARDHLLARLKNEDDILSLLLSDLSEAGLDAPGKI